ncbi:UDP-glucose 4-epimerase family protein [Shewanella chilikensis]|uniref:UDP-glucose 4-epimerase family protein n=1 Tax=Shewanella chilikensis TaxID=558541 RepID=UPI001CF9780B|nr:SDR family oxidoreductase [Shewanella chilikensis]
MILITGSSGFLGRALLNSLVHSNIVTLSRSIEGQKDGCRHIIKDIDSFTDYCNELIDIDCIIHCAARVHVMNDFSCDPLVSYRDVNTAGAINLARQACEAGVKRFVFISSIKVNGESTKEGKPFTPFDPKDPMDYYGQSKSEAEEQLAELAEQTGLEVVIIRPTLVYGPGVKANFASLLKLVSKGLPLPFGCIKFNKRSLVSVTNLVDLIITCIDHPKAANQVFLVSDDHDISTAEMVKHMSQALGKSCRLLPVPLWCYRLVGKLTGKMDVVDRLIGSLQVDITHTKNTLDWTPPQTLEEGFKETAEAFLLNKDR